MRIFIHVSTVNAFFDTSFMSHMFNGLVGSFGDIFDNSNSFNSMVNFQNGMNVGNMFERTPRGRSNHPAGSCLTDQNELFNLDQCNDVGGLPYRAFCQTNCGENEVLCIGSGEDEKTVSSCSYNICYSKIPVIAHRACENITDICHEVYNTDCSSERIWPVCGSDGVEYDNACYMKRAACDADVEITPSENACSSILSNSLNDLSIMISGFTQSFPQMLPVTETDNCDSILCAMNHDPVCGSDGKTYGNSCMLNAQTCRKSWLTEISNEACDCPAACPTVLEPVCGTDKETYGNVCLLMKEGCINKGKQGLFVDSPGVCLEDNLAGEESGSHQDKEPALMIEGDKIVVIEGDKLVERRDCGSCAKTYGPVCGSDGSSYLSERCFYVAKCKQGNSAEFTITKQSWCTQEDSDRYWMGYNQETGEYVGNSPDLIEQRPIEQKPTEHRPMEQRPILQRPTSIFEQRPMSIFEQRPMTMIEQRPVHMIAQGPVSMFEQRPMNFMEQRPMNIEQRPMRITPMGNIEPRPISSIFSQNSFFDTMFQKPLSFFLSEEDRAEENVNRDPKN